MNKGGVVVSLDMIPEFAANLLKISLHSKEFREKYPKTSEQLENFLRELSVHLGVKHP